MCQVTPLLKYKSVSKTLVSPLPKEVVLCYCKFLYFNYISDVAHQETAFIEDLVIVPHHKTFYCVKMFLHLPGFLYYCIFVSVVVGRCARCGCRRGSEHTAPGDRHSCEIISGRIIDRVIR